MPAAEPVYALIGEDSFLILQKLAEIARLLPTDAARIEFDGKIFRSDIGWREVARAGAP